MKGIEMKNSVLGMMIFVLLLANQLFGLPPKEEFRAAWVATVYRIDWPGSSAVSTQKNQMITILNKLQSNHFNAMVFQIRPACDAFYASEIEPWSNWLTGSEGVAPNPFYDPLEFAIEESHKRGLELHAWFNPYRAKYGNAGSTASHVFNTHPEWILTIGSKENDLCFSRMDEPGDVKAPTYILDPGKAAVREYVVGVIADVATRYDIDGVHMDDYFYPYSGIQNEDAATFSEEPRGFTNIHDWRRDNINLLIAAIHDTLLTINPKIKFGMSPFGIWKNGVPSGIVGLDAYNVIYCDGVKWLNEQWVDYLTPQLYWPFSGGQDYGKLMPWWAGIAANSERHLYVGQAAYRITDWTNGEMPRQIRLNRQTEAALGSIYFSYKTIPGANPRGFLDSLQNNYYQYPAVPPRMLWKDSIAAPEPRNLQISYENSALHLTWEAGTISKAQEDSAWRYIVYKWPNGDTLDFNNPQWIAAIIPASSPLSYTDSDYHGYQYAVAAQDRLSNESLAIETGPASIPAESLNPQNWRLFPAYPNPFNPQTTIRYQAPSSEDITLSICDLSGREILRKEMKASQSGIGAFIWNAQNQATGIYFITLKSTSFQASQKLLLVK
jgi:uncharacterized lipoprotein YddW (UPF0748 family)